MKIGYCDSCLTLKLIYICEDCKSSYCYQCLSTNIKIPHTLCDCKNNITCKNNCNTCSLPSYHMITDNIAIGDYNSPYDDFDIIVNLNYPYNYVQVYKITRNVMDNKLIYNIGLYDGVDQPMGKILEIMISELLKELKESPNKKILFHCYAGISRSSTLAIALIHKLTKMPLVDIYKLAVSKRPQVEPNTGFIRALTYYTNDKSLLQYLVNKKVIN